MKNCAHPEQVFTAEILTNIIAFLLNDGSNNLLGYKKSIRAIKTCYY